VESIAMNANARRHRGPEATLSCIRNIWRASGHRSRRFADPHPRVLVEPTSAVGRNQVDPLIGHRVSKRAKFTGAAGMASIHELELLTGRPRRILAKRKVRTDSLPRKRVREPRISNSRAWGMQERAPVSPNWNCSGENDDAVENSIDYTIRE